MSSPSHASELALRTWTRTRRQAAPAVSWVKGITHSPRRAALSGCAVILLIVAIVTPLSRGDVIDSVQFSIAFLATLLTGEAVIFALSFSPSSAWPSLREIDAHIAFREWVVAGWLASMLTAGGLLLHTAIPGTYGALLFLLANVFGMFSFIRLFGLASADGRQRLLRRTLANALDTVTTPAPGLHRRMQANPVLNAYLGQLDEAAARSDGNGVRELVEQLSTIQATMNGRPPSPCTWTSRTGWSRPRWSASSTRSSGPPRPRCSSARSSPAPPPRPRRTGNNARRAPGGGGYGPGQPLPGLAGEHVADVVGAGRHHGERGPGTGGVQRPGPGPDPAARRP